MRRRRSQGAINLLDRKLEKAWIALQAAMDGDAFVKAVFRILKGVVRCDFVNACVRNVPTAEGSVTFRMIDSRGREFDREFLMGVFFREHPGMAVLTANPGIRFINTREILAEEAVLHRTRFYREVMQVIGFRHAVGLFFWDDPPRAPEAIFSLLRVEGQTDFDPTEVALLARLLPHLDAVFRRVQMLEKAATVRRGLRALALRTTRAVCLLDWNLQVTEISRAARESCTRWNLGAKRARQLKSTPFILPAALREVCVELSARWNASRQGHPSAAREKVRVVLHSTNSSVRAVISMYTPEDSPLGKPGFLIEFEHLKSFGITETGKCHNGAVLELLTEGEREIVGFVCEGSSNQEIAERTGKALGSVKNGLHRVFKKLCIRSRGQLIAAMHS